MSDKTARPDHQGSSAADEDVPARNRRGGIVAGSLLAAVALAGAGVLLLGGGSGDEAQVALVAVQAPPGTPSPSPSPSATAPTTLAPPAPARDPFRALLVETAATTAPTAPDPVVADLSPAPVEVPAPGPSGPPQPADEVPAGGLVQGPTLGPVPPPGPSAPSAAPGPDATRGWTSLVLQRVRGDGDEMTAEFLVDGTRVTARIGEQLGATQVRLLSLQQDPADDHWTAVLKDGRGEPFDTAIGVAVRLS